MWRTVKFVYKTLTTYKFYARYVKCDQLAADATEAVRKGDLKIIPEHHTKIWYHWMEGIRDWCVSRQLWWGHRIPAYHVSFNDDSIKAGTVSTLLTLAIIHYFFMTLILLF